MASGVELVRRRVTDAISPALAPGEPLTVWLGAGASVTSGAPLTGQVVDALSFRAAGRGRESGNDITAAFNGWTRDERLTAVQPLFDGFRPYLGYRLLASIARTRPVRVVNLNWDLGAEIACQLLGVPCIGFDVADLAGHPEYLDVSRSRESGMVVAHVHGMLPAADGSGTTGDIRYSTDTTLQVPADVFNLLRDQFLAHVTMVVGASLSGDTDVDDLLRRLAEDLAGGHPKPVWVFSRGEHERESVALDWLRARGSRYNVVSDPAVDFDRIMMHLAEALNGHHLGTAGYDLPGLALPDRDGMLMPSADVLRRVLDQPVITLVGAPEVGKTTTAVLLAHIAGLCSPGPSAAVPRMTSAASEAAVLLAGPVTAPVVIDDAFIGGPSDATLAAALAGANAAAGWNPVVVTAARGVARALPADCSPPADGVLDTDELYAAHEFRLLTTPDQRTVRAHIDLGRITTVGELRRALQGQGKCGDVKQDALAVFAAQPRVALLAALVRLQYFSDDPRPLAELVKQVAGHDNPDLARAAAWTLDLIDLDGDDHAYAWTRHSAVDAVDAMLADPTNPISVAVADLARTTPWIAEAMTVSAVFRTGRTEVEAAWTTLPDPQRLEWLPSLYETFPHSAALFSDESRLDRLDAWGRCELALNLLEAWNNSNPTANALLTYLLSNRVGNGTYALTEAACYLGDGTPAKPKDLIVAGLWRLLDKPNLGEALRCYDALLWQNDNLAAIGVSQDWLGALLDAADPNGSPNVAQGALLVIHAYHARSADLLTRLDRGDRLDRSVRVTPEEARGAVEMIRWHFEHQARNTAIMSRHRHVDLSSLERTRKTNTDDAGDRRARHLLEALLPIGIGLGWVAVAGLNLMSTHPRGDYTDIVNRALEQADYDDPGLVAALLGYTIPEGCKTVARDRFRGVADRALDALTVGIGTRDGAAADLDWDSSGIVEPPRFSLARRPHQQLVRLGYRSDGLTRLGFDLPGRADDATAQLRRHRADAVAAFGPAIVDALLRRTDVGDFRDFDQLSHVAARTPAGAPPQPPLLQAFNLIAAHRLAAQSPPDTPPTLDQA